MLIDTKDIRYGIRAVLRNRGFTAVASITLALGGRLTLWRQSGRPVDLGGHEPAAARDGARGLPDSGVARRRDPSSRNFTRAVAAPGRRVPCKFR